MEYRHTQVGTVLILGLLVPFIAIFVVPIYLGGFPPVLLAALAILVISFPLFYSLTVEISGGVLTCYFGVGVFRKRIALSDIREVQAVNNPWFVGWGIRWMPGRYWLWNVSGRRGVELVLKNGSRFRIGTDEPEVLAKAIKLNKMSAT